MEVIELKERQVGDNFWVIVREDCRRPSTSCDGFELNDSKMSSHHMFSSYEKAVEKCKDYASARRTGGYSYRYYVMKSAVVIQFKQENKDGN